jgi:iduronate 2-sulfatase
MRASVWILCLQVLCWVKASAATGPSNILFIAVDDLKPTLGCYGDPIAQTPHLDALARRGMVFTRSFVQQAVCAPSRNSLLTGIRPESLGIYDLATFFRVAEPEVVTWPQAFKAAGWRCEEYGKIEHLGHGNHPDPASWSAPHWIPKGNRYATVRPGAPVLPGNGRRHGASWSAVPGDGGDLADAQIAARAVARLTELQGQGQPFVLAVGFLRPHLPFVAPQRCYDRYDPAGLPVPPETAGLPAGAPAFAGHDSGELRSYTDIPAVGPVDAARARELVHGYYASVTWVDEQVGVLLGALDRLGLAGNTTVVLWGDHGWHLGDHGLWCKHTNFEQATRNALIIAGPGVAAGAVSQSLVETIDLGPTLLTRAGLTPPPTMTGKDLSPILADPQATVHEAVFHCYPRKIDGAPVLGRAVRDPRFRLVLWQRFDDGATIGRELYDLERDPAETANLIGRPEHAADEARLAALLAAQAPARPPVTAKAKAP